MTENYSQDGEKDVTPAIDRRAAEQAPGLRPSLLDPLFAPARGLPGIGPKMAPMIERLLGTPERPARIVDLLFHLPQGGVARRLMGSISEAPPGEPVTVGVTVTGYRAPQPGPGKRPYRVLVEDPTGDITLVFFGMPAPRVEKMLPLGAHRYVTGRIDLWDGHRQMVHPSRIVDEAGFAALPAVEPVYGATEGDLEARPRRPRPPAGAARMAGRGLAEAERPAGLRRRAPGRAQAGRTPSPGRRRRHGAGHPGPAPPRL